MKYTFTRTVLKRRGKFRIWFVTLTFSKRGAIDILERKYVLTTSQNSHRFIENNQLEEREMFRKKNLVVLYKAFVAK